MQQWVVGVVGLNDDRARFLGAAGTAGDLEDQLRHALRRPESRCRTTLVGIDDPHQGHLGKVVALGQHLGADQDAASPL